MSPLKHGINEKSLFTQKKVKKFHRSDGFGVLILFPAQKCFYIIFVT